MARFKYFSDVNGTTVELTNVYYDGRKAFGTPVGTTPVYDRVAQKWTGRDVPATRIIEMKSRPSRHECDSRCLNAIGKVMRCECSCGGKNHGRGSVLVCEAA